MAQHSLRCLPLDDLGEDYDAVFPMNGIDFVDRPMALAKNLTLWSNSPQLAAIVYPSSLPFSATRTGLSARLSRETSPARSSHKLNLRRKEYKFSADNRRTSLAINSGQSSERM